MKFYSGFALKNEEYLFSEFIKNSEYTICGFSYGAIKALKATQESLAKSNRVDTLQLFSPAFFQSKDEKFKRLQLMSYKKNKEIYLKQFISSCFEPHEKKIVEHINSTIDELRELLEYEWNIIDVNAAKELFLDVATVTYIKDANHFLQLN